MREQRGDSSFEGREKMEGGRVLLALTSSLLALLSPLLALSSSLASLPPSLIALEGLQFDGRQWLETGYCPTASDRFECEVAVDAVQTNGTAAVFGMVRELESERTMAFYVREDGDDSTVVVYGDAARGGFFPRGRKVSLTVGPDGAMWTWEGGADRLELTSGFARDGVTPLMIGDVNASSFVGGSVPAGTGAAMTLYRFRIWRGGLELIHDYVPCLNETNCLYGVYDTVGEKFLPIRPYVGLPQAVITSIAVVRTNNTVEVGVKTEPNRTYVLLRSPTLTSRPDYVRIGAEATADSNRLVLVDQDKDRPKNQAFYIVVTR